MQWRWRRIQEEEEDAVSEDEYPTSRLLFVSKSDVFCSGDNRNMFCIPLIMCSVPVIMFKSENPISPACVNKQGHASQTNLL